MRGMRKTIQAIRMESNRLQCRMPERKKLHYAAKNLSEKERRSRQKEFTKEVGP